MHRFLASAAVFLPYVVGWTGGIVVRFLRWLWAAVVAGYADGTGGADWRKSVV